MIAQEVIRGERLLEASDIRRLITRLSHEIAERHRGDRPVLVGIPTRGVPIATRIAAALRLLGMPADVASAHHARYRDDQVRPEASGPPLHAMGTSRELRVADRVVIVIDDVIATGRSCRAAVEAVLAMGRPRSVELLALIDRGTREIPLEAMYVGKNVPVQERKRVRVALSEVDGVDGAWIVEGRHQ